MTTDTGCKIATEYLNHQSSCLKCPFDKCIYDEPIKNTYQSAYRVKTIKRNQAILDRVKAGVHTKEIAREFSLSERTIQRVLRSL